MPKKPKHPKDMTNDEAVRHLFKRKGHSIIKKHIKKFVKDSSTTKG